MTVENDTFTSADAIASIAPELTKHFGQGGFKTLEQVAQFSPEGYVKRPIFSTDSLQFGMYCLEPGQVNALHKHPQSDEIYFVQGTGEVVIGDDVAAVQTGVCIHAPKAVEHEIRNTGAEQMLVIVVQSPPLPRKPER